MDEYLKNNMFATHAIAAVGSVTMGTAVTYPLDTIKVLIQVSSGSNKQWTISQVVKTVQSRSGNSGMYSGFVSSTLGRMLGLGARFGVYEILTAFYKDGREDNYVHISEAFMAGIAAGAVESVIKSPFELVKLRAQVTAACKIPGSSSVTERTVLAPSVARLLHGYRPEKKALDTAVGLMSTLTPNHSNLVGALKEYPWMIAGSGKHPPIYEVRRPSDVISLEGWSALWRGLRSGVVRDSIFGGVFFSSWQFLHQVMLDWKAVGMDPEPETNEEIGPLSPLAVSLSAGLSGSVAAAVSHGFDTSKTRRQCMVLPKYIKMERKCLGLNRRPGNWFERTTGIHPHDRSHLSRGLWLRMARSGFSSFVLVGSYFAILDQFVSR